MERRGSGLKKILDSYQTQEKYSEDLKPEFRSTQSSFFIILKNLNYISSDKVAINSDKVAINSYKNQEQTILDFAKENLLFKTKDIENLLGVKYARARRILSKMVENNLLESIGENRNRQYKIKV